MRRFLFVLVLLTSLTSAISSSAVVPMTASGVACSPGDRPETGVQGQVPLADQLSGRSTEGYSCNLRMVGSNDIAGRGGDTQMTWYDECAYRSTPGGGGDAVAVVDVKNPRKPTLVKLIQEKSWAGKGGTLGIHEGLMVNEKRQLLVVPLGTGCGSTTSASAGRRSCSGASTSGCRPATC